MRLKGSSLQGIISWNSSLLLFLSGSFSSPFVSCPPSVTMKRCLKCVSNQKHCTGNLQSHQGRCEMCSPCRFCGTVPHFLLRWRARSHLPLTVAIVMPWTSVRKFRENPGMLTAGRRPHWPLAASTNINSSSITTERFLSTFMGVTRTCGGSGAGLINSSSVFHLMGKFQ